VAVALPEESAFRGVSCLIKITFINKKSGHQGHFFCCSIFKSALNDRLMQRDFFRKSA
jgi:hypothetical protein